MRQADGVKGIVHALVEGLPSLNGMSTPRCPATAKCLYYPMFPHNQSDYPFNSSKLQPSDALHWTRRLRLCATALI